MVWLPLMRCWHEQRQAPLPADGPRDCRWPSAHPAPPHAALQAEDHALDAALGYPLFTDGPDKLGWLMNLNAVRAGRQEGCHTGRGARLRQGHCASPAKGTVTVMGFATPRMWAGQLNSFPMIQSCIGSRPAVLFQPQLPYPSPPPLLWPVGDGGQGQREERGVRGVLLHVPGRLHVQGAGGARALLLPAGQGEGVVGWGAHVCERSVFVRSVFVCGGGGGVGHCLAAMRAGNVGKCSTGQAGAVWVQWLWPAVICSPLKALSRWRAVLMHARAVGMCEHAAAGWSGDWGRLLQCLLC